MSRRPTIGVLLTAHQERLTDGSLSRCFDSICKQTRGPDQIAVAIDYERVGAAKTKQRALEMLRTQYVSVFDSDDLMKPHHLQIIEKAIVETDADMVYPWFETDPPNQDPFPYSFYASPWDPDHPRHTTTVITARREMMLKVGYSAAPEGIYEDDDWRMTQGLIGAGASVFHIKDRSWIWRHHPGMTTGRGLPR